MVLVTPVCGLSNILISSTRCGDQILWCLARVGVRGEWTKFTFEVGLLGTDLVVLRSEIVSHFRGANRRYTNFLNPNFHSEPLRSITLKVLFFINFGFLADGCHMGGRIIFFIFFFVLFNPLGAYLLQLKQVRLG